MAGDVEREAESPDIPSEEFAEQQQVSRTRYREELGEPLDGSEEGGDERAHWSRLNAS